MVLRQPPSRQQVGILYEMTSPSSLGHASPQTTYVQRHAGRQCATTQTTSIKCCPNLGAIFEALHQYGTTYLYKIPFSQAVANASNLMHWRNDVQLLNYSMYKPLYAGSIRQYMGGLPQKEITFGRQNKEHFQQSSSTFSVFLVCSFLFNQGVFFFKLPRQCIGKNKQTNKYIYIYIYIYTYIYIYIYIYTRHFSKFSLLLTQLCLMGAMDMEKHRKRTCFQSMVVFFFLRQQQIDFLFVYTAFCHETKSIQFISDSPSLSPSSC